jgi:opacity protein-like surface antigen
MGGVGFDNRPVQVALGTTGGRSGMNKNQLLAAIFVTITGSAAAFPAVADEAAQGADLTGFYGGLSMRERGAESEGLQFGHISLAWNKFTSPATDAYGARTLAYGGYRWANDIAVEAAVASADRFALSPEGVAGRRGIGLAFANATDAAARSWNADVYTSWGFAKRFSLYGRLGFVQSEPVASSPGSVAFSDVRRNRDGVNYGVGLRYDVNPVLGLRLEYARYGRLAGETMTGVLPDSDQVQFGLQFRF